MHFLVMSPSSCSFLMALLYAYSNNSRFMSLTYVVPSFQMVIHQLVIEAITKYKYASRHLHISGY